jgi:hypothetical protein
VDPGSVTTAAAGIPPVDRRPLRAFGLPQVFGQQRPMLPISRQSGEYHAVAGLKSQKSQ